MKITCISDTHQHHKKIKIPKCDMIIHAGDFSYHGEEDEVNKFLDWYAKQKIKYKLLIMGNHEKGCAQDIEAFRAKCNNHNIIFLHNESITIEGLKFFGSPYSVKFGPWAFGLQENALEDIWKLIPLDTNVLITHGPAFSVLDQTMVGLSVGSLTLRNYINTLKQLKLHVTGHIHESRGCMYRDYLTVNASVCGIPYTDVIINPVTVVL